MDPTTLISSASAVTGDVSKLVEIRDIAKSSDAALAISELNQRVAHLNNVAAQLLIDITAKDQEIARLAALVEAKAKLVRHNELYFEPDSDGNPTGQPICPRCWEVDGKDIHLVHYSSYKVKCPQCDVKFPREPGVESPPPRPRVRHPGLSDRRL